MGGFYKETTNDENPTGIQFKSDNNITSIDVTMYGLVQSLLIIKYLVMLMG